jgi:hypothetical protein
MALSFNSDIRALFCDSPDVYSMQAYGLDLSSFDEVKARERPRLENEVQCFVSFPG